MNSDTRKASLMDPNEKTTRLVAALNQCDVEFELLDSTVCKDEDLLARQALRALQAVVEVLVDEMAYERTSTEGGWLRFPGLAIQLEARRARRQKEL